MVAWSALRAREAVGERGSIGSRSQHPPRRGIQVLEMSLLVQMAHDSIVQRLQYRNAASAGLAPCRHAPLVARCQSFSPKAPKAPSTCSSRMTAEDPRPRLEFPAGGMRPLWSSTLRVRRRRSVTVRASSREITMGQSPTRKVPLAWRCDRRSSGPAAHRSPRPRSAALVAGPPGRTIDRGPVTCGAPAPAWVPSSGGAAPPGRPRRDPATHVRGSAAGSATNRSPVTSRRRHWPVGRRGERAAPPT